MMHGHMILRWLLLPMAVLSEKSQGGNLRKLQRKNHDDLGSELTRWCSSEYQSYDPHQSCSSLTVPGTGEKCVPTTRKMSCESSLLAVFETFGSGRARMVARTTGCRCESIAWKGINGRSAYNIELVAHSYTSDFAGPLVVGDDLYWSALEVGIMHRDADGVVSILVLASDTFVPHGLAWDYKKGTLIVTSKHMTGEGAVYRVEKKDNSLTKLTEGIPLNAPNDVVVMLDGTIYFTDPFWRLLQSRQADGTGVYRIDKKMNGVVTMEYNFQRHSNLAQPNGLSLSEDESKLYVSLAGTSQVVEFNVGLEDGTLVYMGEVEKLPVKYTPDGMTIKDDTLYVGTNMDYIMALDLTGSGNTHSIDLFDAGIYGINSVAIDKSNGTLYVTQRYPGVKGDKIFQLTPKSP